MTVKSWFKDDYGWWRIWTIVVLVVVLVVAVLGAVGFGFYYAEKASCSAWGRSAGRETRWETLTVVEWECFVKMPDGTWLPKDQLRGNEDSR